MTIKVIFAAVISATLLAALPQYRAQAATQQDRAPRLKEEVAKAKEERAKKKAAASEARKKAREERLKAAEARSATHRQTIEARHEKMRNCETKWLDHKKSTSNISRNAYFAFMKTCQSQ